MSKIAIFFDAENTSASKIPDIISFLASKGDILYQRAYADWSNPSTKPWQSQMSKTPITAIQQFHNGEKQAVDKTIMMDAIQLAVQNDEIGIFALVSSDNGFHSLSLRLRELGKNVVGFGEKQKCNQIWINSCNEFKYLEDLEEVDEDIFLQNSEKEAAKILPKDFAVETFLEQAFDSTPLYKETNSVLLARMWESVLRLKSDFNFKDYGKKSVLDFISSYTEKFKVTDDGKSQKAYFVEKIISTSSQRKIGTIKRWIGNYIIINADDGDYFSYTKEINKEFKKQKLTKGAKVDFSVEKLPNLQGGNSRDKNGRAGDIKIVE